MIAVAVGQPDEKSPEAIRQWSIKVARRRAIALSGLLHRLWWHTTAYRVSVGILLLLGVSLAVLRLHSFYQMNFKRAGLSGNSHFPVPAHNGSAIAAARCLLSLFHHLIQRKLELRHASELIDGHS